MEASSYINTSRIGSSSKKKRSRFGVGPPVENIGKDKKNIQPPGVVHISSLGSKTKETESTSQSTGIEFSALPCTTYPSYDAYEANKEKADPKEHARKIAAAAAAKINASLIAQGKIKPPDPTAIKTPPSIITKKSLSSHPTAPPDLTKANTTVVPPIKATEITQNDDFFVSEVEINDVPIGCRNYLTRTITQDKITTSTKAYVCTKGKYMSPAEKASDSSNEKPLYLHVQATNIEYVKSAVERIKQIIGNHFQKKMGISTNQSPAQTQMKPCPPAPSVYPGFTPPVATTMQAPLPAAQFVQEKVFIGMDDAPPSFDLKSRLLGVNYQNFNFISSETGAQVILRGRGSGYVEPTSGKESFESMYAFISHPNQQGIEAAKSLVLSLVATIQKDLTQLMGTPAYTTSNIGSNANSYYQNYQTMPVPPPPPETVPALPKSIKRKFTEEVPNPSNVLGYTSVHGKMGLPLEPSKIDSYKKSRFKVDPTPPVTPPDDKSTEKSTFKSPALPFWMTP